MRKQTGKSLTQWYLIHLLSVFLSSFSEFKGVTNLMVSFILHTERGHISGDKVLRWSVPERLLEVTRGPLSAFQHACWTVSLGARPVVGPTLCGCPWLRLSERRSKLGLPREFCWFSLRSLEQKRKEACCDHHSHLLPEYEGRIYQHLFTTEVKLT